jgi:hypothetical protein
MILFFSIEKLTETLKTAGANSRIEQSWDFR